MRDICEFYAGQCQRKEILSGVMEGVTNAIWIQWENSTSQSD